MNQQHIQIYIEEYLYHIIHFSGLSDHSQKAYASDLNQFKVFLSDSSIATDINDFTLMLKEYFQKLLNSNNLTPATIKRKFTVLHKFFNYLEQNHYLQPNPFHTFSFKLRQEKSLPRVLQKQELSLLITTIRDRIPCLSPYHSLIAIRDLAIIDLLICTGMRIGEITRLTLQDYDSSTNTLLIKGKGHKERILYISSTDVVDEMSRWLYHRSALTPKCDSFFINKYGNTFSIYGIENIFYKYRTLSKINIHATPHYLRHTFASDDTFAA